MAELLWDSRYEESDRRPEQVAISQNPDVHMETMEEAKDEGKKSIENGSARGFSLAGRQQSKRILVYDPNGSHKHGNDKKRLINSGFYDLATAYQSVHV